MDNYDIDFSVNRIMILRNQIEELQSQIDVLKEELQDEIQSRGERKIDTGCYTVMYYVYKQRRVDTEKLKADNLYDTYVKWIESNYFKVGQSNSIRSKVLSQINI